MRPEREIIARPGNEMDIFRKLILLRQPIISDVTYDVGAPTVYRRIY